MVNISELEQEIKNNITKNREEQIYQLQTCLRSEVTSNEKAYCAYKIGMINFLREDDVEERSKSIKYLHLAHELSPDNSTYANISCLYSFAEIIKYSSQKSFTENQAKGLLANLIFFPKCKEYQLPWQGYPKSDDYMVAQAANNLGLYYQAQERTIVNLKAAKFCFKAAYNIAPKNVIYGANLGSIHYELGESQEAASLYLDCVNSKNSENQVNKANCANALTLIYFKDKEYSKALPFAKQAHKLDPENAYYMYNIASAYLVTRQFDQAKYFYQQCSESEVTGLFTEVMKVECFKGLEVVGALGDFS